jgi:hypothetical protein
MKRPLLLAIVFGAASVVPGQTPSTTAGACKLTMAKAPAIRGLRLGMTIDQTLALFPGAQADSDVRAEQFAARVAEALSLPGLGSWKPIPNGLALACEGFQIGVSRAGANSIHMNDLQVDVGKVVNDRAEVPKEQARRAFKP